MTTAAIRLRSASSELLALPWELPLESWPEAGVVFRERPVGASRHVVRFVAIGRMTYALKEEPIAIARREYEILRELEGREFPAVRAVGLVERLQEDAAILVTDYLEHSLQFRRLFQRLPSGSWKHRERLLDAMAGLLVDLHRNGTFWGDCSLSNTLFRRDGQMLQAFLVDAETSEIHPGLSEGQREFDLEILVENVAGDLADLDAELGRPGDLLDEDFRAAESMADRYRGLWDELHRVDTVSAADRYLVEARVRRLNELGFAIDELALEPVGDLDRLRLKVAVASRRFHAQELRDWTGLNVGQGQATILLNDIRAYRGLLERRSGREVTRTEAASLWLNEVVHPALQRLAAGAHPPADPIQGYCDLLEVRWLLSEEAGHDVGDEAAMDALARRLAPEESAAVLAVAESPTGAFKVTEGAAPPPTGAADSDGGLDHRAPTSKASWEAPGAPDPAG